MADNVILDIMAGGDSLAADDIGGVKYQRIKIVLGGNGVNDGDVSSSNPLPVGSSVTDAPSYGGESIGITAGQLPSQAIKRYVDMRASSNNMANISVGSDSGVTINRGLILFPGNGVRLFISNLNLAWCISDVDGQILTWTAV